MSIAEQTQVEVPTPTEVVAPETTAEAPVTEPTSPGAEPASGPEKPPWADIADPYDLYDSDHLKEIRERDLKRTQERIRGEVGAEYDVKMRDWESTEYHRSLNNIVGNVLQKIEDGDGDGADKALARLETMSEPFKQQFREAIHRDASRQVANYFYSALTDSIPERKAKDDFEDWISSGSRDWSDVIKRHTGAVVAAAEARGRAAGAKEARQAMATDAAAERNGQGNIGPDGTPGRASGGRTYKDMSFEERQALSPAERDRLANQNT